MEFICYIPFRLPSDGISQYSMPRVSINFAYFILRWVVHILDGGVEDIGLGGEFRMQFFFVSVKTGRKVANLSQA